GQDLNCGLAGQLTLMLIYRLLFWRDFCCGFYWPDLAYSSNILIYNNIISNFETIRIEFCCAPIVQILFGVRVMLR
ncbi:MAG TPA: hypothetical protein PLK94_09680, partial [Alphaproteobacteria bacterium]|nr:hypothetical protein [Alphaproteobacteria bacterium]